MAHERIKTLATKVYTELEEKAALAVFVPARLLVIENVEKAYHGGRRERGCSGGDYSCRFDSDIAMGGDTLEETFRYFLELKHWSVRREHHDGEIYDIYLKAEHNGKLLQINLCNDDCPKTGRYLVGSVVYTSDGGDELRIIDHGSRPFSVYVNGQEDEDIIFCILDYGPNVASRLITEAHSMVLDMMGSDGLLRSMGGLSFENSHGYTQTTVEVPQELLSRIGDRDKDILVSLLERGQLTTGQIKDLHFTCHASPSAALRAVNRAVLKLRDYGLIKSPKKRVGGIRAGSKGYIWSLTDMGVVLLKLNNADDSL